MKRKNNKVFITGASGNIGKYLVDKLLKDGYKITVLTRNPSYINANKNIKVVVADIIEIDKYKKQMCSCKYVFHLAAYQNMFDKKYDEFKRVNVDGTKVIIEAIRSSNVKKLFYVSTTMVFDKKDIKNNYVRSKLEALKIVKASKIPWIVIYPSIVVNLNVKNNNRFYNFLTDGIPGGLMMRLCNKNKKFNFIWIDELVKSMLELLDKGVVHRDYILKGKEFSAENYLKEAYRKKGRKYIPWRIPILQ